MRKRKAIALPKITNEDLLLAVMSSNLGRIEADNARLRDELGPVIVAGPPYGGERRPLGPGDKMYEAAQNDRATRLAQILGAMLERTGPVRVTCNDVARVNPVGLSIVEDLARCEFVLEYRKG